MPTPRENYKKKDRKFARILYVILFVTTAIFLYAKMIYVNGSSENKKALIITYYVFTVFIILLIYVILKSLIYKEYQKNEEEYQNANSGIIRTVDVSTNQNHNDQLITTSRTTATVNGTEREIITIQIDRPLGIPTAPPEEHTIHLNPHSQTPQTHHNSQKTSGDEAPPSYDDVAYNLSKQK
ncbi:CLUMA_CG019152, isoform A [Clunio marinus]|uniref:CLUMA_CG019152, isoform A n=1 Tax=Clunio marinus TaxID=568069 RepID=A0A1J1J5R1_9DIPT|nr:CLUMA_CG019152, isoform A [Clunio marinus]